MLIIENILLALSALRANKTRAFLTMLGIIIGISSVITIMTIGQAMTNALNDEMGGLGATNITISVSQRRTKTERSDSGFMFRDGPRRNDMKDEDKITLDMVEALKEEFKDQIDGVMLKQSIGNGEVKHLKEYANVSVAGQNDISMKKEDLTMLAGRQFTAIDQKEGRKVCVVSDYMVGNMFDEDNEGALGQQITVVIDNKFYHYTIVGVYQYNKNDPYNSDDHYDTSTTLYLPLETAVRQAHSKNRFTEITAIGSTGEDIDALMKEIKSFLNSKYYRNNENYEISCMSLASMIESLTEMMNTMSLAISFIAGISLLVGGIGVMNIMLVSVTERTKEIGTRKALGATNSSIRLQFIVESITLCVAGGIIGVAFGVLLGNIISKIMQFSAAAPIGGIVIAVLFSMAIGVFFGYYPANKAAKMNPIDALRYE
ncbi:MAG: ABC transporter permease [Lachnospiraceae bacterium]|nr:ABC transporter permease [Lachnospiraceae bacterium]